MTTTIPPQPPRDSLALSQKLTVAKLVGQGRLGTVYVGVHPVLARRFAVKVLGSFLTRSEETCRRLRHAMREASAVEHPNVVALTDFGQIPDGRFYLTMEYVRGIQLTKVLNRDSRFAPNRAIPLLIQLADALEAAHRLRVVHADVKPNNILLAERAKGEEILKLHDFSLTSTLAEPTEDTDKPVSSLSIYGSADYLAPEQFSSRIIDGRVDIYAFGCLAYRMLTGQPPFVGSSPEEVVKAHLSSEPVPPSRRGGGQSISSKLDELVLHCLEKDPAARWASMGAIGRELRLLMPTTTAVSFEESATGRWELPEEEAQEEPLPDSPARLRRFFYDTILELADHIAEEGLAPDGMLEVTENLKKSKEETTTLVAQIELTENRFEDIRRELRERESILRYAIIDLNLAKNDLIERGADATDIGDIGKQVVELEVNLAALEKQRAERFAVLNEELKKQREQDKVLEQKLVVLYRRLYAELDELRSVVRTVQSRSLYRLLERIRAAMARSHPGTTGH